MKPKASDRTVDMFTGKTKAEELAAAIEDIYENPKSAETIPEAAERWRANAFFTQQHISKHFEDSEYVGGKYRLTEDDKWMYLERYGTNKPGSVATYTGLMFPKSDIGELTGVFVKAYRGRNDS